MSEPLNGGSLPYRVSELERDLAKLENRVEKQAEIREAVAVLRAEFQGFVIAFNTRLDKLEASLNQDIENFDGDVKGLRRVLIGAAVTVMIAAITFAITSLAVFGAPGH